ncbi:unnamed protein product [Caenorhabditis bovis]|uniref:Galectin n=1 Tax=Caenorhabditis bovis TaxID=2654633 RepID=A0A8S1EUE1_9PELO|nr:unnamed protein product [Caenorhabditis bovis]
MPSNNLHLQLLLFNFIIQSARCEKLAQCNVASTDVAQNPNFNLARPLQHFHSIEFTGQIGDEMTPLEPNTNINLVRPLQHFHSIEFTGRIGDEMPWYSFNLMTMKDIPLHMKKSGEGTVYSKFEDEKWPRREPEMEPALIGTNSAFNVTVKKTPDEFHVFANNTLMKVYPIRNESSLIVTVNVNNISSITIKQVRDEFAACSPPARCSLPEVDVIQSIPIFMNGPPAMCRLLFPLSLVWLANGCPKGWHQDGRTCYHLSRRRMTLNDAHRYCHRLANDSHVLRIECGKENAYITQLGRRTHSNVWIDARARFDIVDGSAGLFGPGFVYRWPNGKIVRYSNWAPGNGIEEIHKKDKCVAMRSDGTWINAACATPAAVVCEKRMHHAAAKNCPNHWVHNERFQSCYRTLSKTNMTILEADNRCFDYGLEHRQDAMLTSVGNADENEFIMNLAKATNPNVEFIYLGGYGRSNNGHKWHWMDGSAFDYLNWDRGMPFGRRALAVLVMNRRGKWINHYADKILSQYNAVAVCKFKT